METTNNNNIKIIRLHGGEDIIANFIESEDKETAILHDPMQVIFKRIPTTGQTVMMMMPWLPIEIIENNQAILCTADILTVIDPKESAIQHYGEVVMEAQKRMDEVDFISESEDGDEDDEEENSEEETKDFNVDDLLEIIKEKKNKKLH
jgi:hypothetical protein